MKMHLSQILLCLTLGACAEGTVDGCIDAEESIGLADATTAGSAQALLELVEGSQQSTLTGPAFSNLGLMIDVRWTGDDASWNDRAPAPATPTTEGEIVAEAVCADTLSVPVEVTFSTDDGQFDETWQTTAQSTAEGEAAIVHELPIDQLRGTWAPDAGDYAQMRLQVDMHWTADGHFGVLRLIGTPEDGGPEEAWDVAIWPAA